MANQLPSIYKNIAAPAGSNPQDVQSARDQMAMQFAPQEMGINTAINQINQYLQQDISAQQQYGQIADQKISQIGSELANTLQGNVGKVSDIYQKGTAAVGGAYDEAQKTLGAIGQSVQAPIAQGYANLGIKADQFGRDPLSRLQGDLAVYQSRNAAGKATATANMEQLGTALTGIAQKAVGDSERDYAQKRSNVATQVLQTIGKLQTTAQTGVMGQLQKFSDLAETAGPAFRQLLNQATSSRNRAEQDAAQQQLDNYIKLSNLSLDQQREQRAGQADDPNSLDNLIKQTTLEKNLRGLDESDKYTDAATGHHNMMEWLNDLRVNRKVLTGRQYAGVQNFINQNASNASIMGQDPYTYLVNLAQSQSGKGGLVQTPRGEGATGTTQHYQVPLEVILEALNKRYTGVASSGSKIGTKVK